MEFIYYLNKNKKGAEKVLSVYWFVMLVIVAGGIYGMVLTFYDHPFDVRELEVNILSNKVIECISQKGIISEGVFNESSGLVSSYFENNFLEKCNMIFEVEKEYGWERDFQFYLEIKFYNLSNLDKPFSIISEGSKKWVSDIEINKDKNFNLLGNWLKKRFYSTYKSKQILIEVVSIIRKTEKNVKK